MNNPKITVIVPIYNVEIYLEKCLESILNQSYKNLEIILIDDGSSDGSLDIARKYKDLDERVLLFSIANSGVSAARNLALEKATGEYITFVDSDDWLDIETYQNLIDKLTSSNNPLDSIIYSYIREFPNRSERESLDFPKELLLKNEEILDKWILDLISGVDERESYIMATIWRCLYKTSIIKTHNIFFDPKLSYAEDLVFNLKYFTNCSTILILNEPYYHYRFNLNSAVTRYDNKLWEKNLLVNELIQEIFKDKENEQINNRINSRLVSVAVGSMANIFHKDNPAREVEKFKSLSNILNNNRLKEVKKTYSIQNKKYVLLTSSPALIPYSIIKANNFMKKLKKGQ